MNKELTTFTRDSWHNIYFGYFAIGLRMELYFRGCLRGTGHRLVVKTGRFDFHKEPRGFVEVSEQEPF